MQKKLLPPALIAFIAVATPAFAPPAAAQDLCGGMLIPAVQLKEVSRGFTRYHTGVDLMAPYGSPIRAAFAGTIVFAGRYFGYGNMVDLRHADGTVTRYAHMAAFAPGIRPGAVVATGGVLGQVGTSGRAHGPHVHFEVRVDGRAIDPKPFVALAACTGTPRHETIEVARAPDPRAPIDARPGGLTQ